MAHDHQRITRRQGRAERLDVRFAGARGWALVAHILARNGVERGARFLSVSEMLRVVLAGDVSRERL